MSRKLFALPLTDDNMTLALQERFGRITSTYILVYSETAPDGGYQITGNDLLELNDADQDWLLVCFHDEAREYVRQHEEEVATAQKNFMQEFERELQAEAAKIEGES